ncbi:MAG TPA: hypothetical protein VFE90_17075 [Myxococcales bacterium]|nr:hypothetical protein [Myxococcales bacterium]
MTAREYIEAVALELGRVRGKGLFLSPVDAQLALSWHAADVPLSAVLGEVRKAVRLRGGRATRGAAQLSISLQAVARSVERFRPRPGPQPKAEGLGAELRAACRPAGLAARATWQSLADVAEDLLAHHGADGYWTAAVRALKESLRELPRSASLRAGAALRERLAPRPAGMSRRSYQRSLQLMLLSAASERLGLPPRAFLL